MLDPQDTALASRPDLHLAHRGSDHPAPQLSLPIQSTGPIALPTAAPALEPAPVREPAPVLEFTPAPGPDATSNWLPRYVAALVALDTLALMLGGLLGHLVRFDSLSGRLDLGGHFTGISYRDILLATVPFWLLAMATARTYEGRYLGLGSEEFRRVGNAAARFTALIAVTVFLFKWDIARGLMILALPAATAFTLVFRFLARKVLHRVRKDGAASHRVLVVGDGDTRDVLVQKLAASPHSGLHVVGVAPPLATGQSGSPSVGHLRTLVQSLRADTVAVAHSPDVSPAVLRELAWSLEGIGVSLLLAPALTDVAGPRVSIRPVSGLPLLQVAEPELTGVRRLAKGTFDVVVSSLGLILASPILAGLALAVRLSSPGPVLFRQVRIGKDGKEFTMFKFRSMHADAEARLDELRAHNDHGDGVLFKMREDPRITTVGKVLRRYSLDELPQLLNVLRGHMSLVGPRPPLPIEVARYARQVHRRLLVKPGLTGLWQVSGRSDLDWDEAVRLDLYYVENWSVALDAEIVWKTAWAVLRGSGAR